MLCHEEPSSKAKENDEPGDAPASRSVPADASTTSPVPPGTREVELSEIWSEVRAGRLRVVSGLCSDERCYLTLRWADPERADMAYFARGHLGLLERVLLGERQKVLAIDLGVSPSTIALTLRRCLRALGVDCRFQRVPLLVVMAAHAYHHPERRTRVKGRLTVHESGRDLLLSAECPRGALGGALGAEEAAVTLMWLQGKSHREIAELRGRSPHTVSNQLAATYGKLGVSGRFELVGKLMSTDGATAGSRP